MSADNNSNIPDDADLLIQRAMEDPEKARAIVALLGDTPKPKSVEKYDIKVRHTITCLLCDNIYVETYKSKYTQHMSRHNPADKVEQVNYEHTCEVCHNCKDRLMQMPRSDAIDKAIRRVRILSRSCVE